MDIALIGSGSEISIDSKLYDVCCFTNSSITRAQNLDRKKTYLITSEAMFFEENDLDKLNPIKGYSKKHSNELRLRKYSSIDNSNLNKLTIIRGNLKKDIRERLTKKNINAEKVILISSKKKWFLLLKAMGIRGTLYFIKRIKGKKNKFFFLFSLISLRNLPINLRPSTGIMTVIISINEFGTKHNFHISGINEGNNETYYKDFGLGEKQSMNHHFDSLYLNAIKFDKKITLTKI